MGFTGYIQVSTPLNRVRFRTPWHSFCPSAERSALTAELGEVQTVQSGKG